MKSGPALFMRKGMTWKFPFFLYHSIATACMEEIGFKHWGNWKISGISSLIFSLTVHDEITMPPIDKNNRI